MSMIGNIDDGEYHLQIKNVSLADDDNYRVNFEILFIISKLTNENLLGKRFLIREFRD